MARIEPEIGFVLSRDLRPRDNNYTEEEVGDAIGEVHLALELVGCRYLDPGAVSFPEMLADSISNAGLFVGPLVNRAPVNFPAAMPIALKNGGEIRNYDGRHRDGNPIRPVVWLANFLNSRGDLLRAGQVVITGSYAGVLEAPLGSPVKIQFGDLGEIAVEFTTGS